LDGEAQRPDFRDIIAQVRRFTGCSIVEAMIVDARARNGLLLPDFFDFT
jgi:hypothetical protein